MTCADAKFQMIDSGLVQRENNLLFWAQDRKHDILYYISSILAICLSSLGHKDGCSNLGPAAPNMEAREARRYSCTYFISRTSNNLAAVNGLFSSL